MNLTLTGDVNMKRRIKEQEKIIEQVRRTLRNTRRSIARQVESLHLRDEIVDVFGGLILDLAECERALAKVGQGET